MELKQLKNKDFEEVMALFCLCFNDDPFYEKLFPDKSTRKEDMAKQFGGNVRFYLENGISYGLAEEGSLVGFILCFDYFATKKEHSKEFYSTFGAKEQSDSQLPYYEKIHLPIEEIGNNAVFCLSVAIDPRYRRMGLGSLLMDKILSHNCNVFSDVSNTSSLEIYKKRGFEISEIDKEYYFISRKANTQSTLDFSDKILLAVPDEALLQKIGISYKLHKTAHCLLDVSITEHNGESFFVPMENVVSTAVVAEVDYSNLLVFQRYINLSQNEEIIRGGIVYYTLNTPYENPRLENEILKNMLLSRQQEWGIVPDTYVSVPVQYEDYEKIMLASDNSDVKAKLLLRILDFRTKYEMGIPSRSKSADDTSSLKTRIERVYLGKLKVKILEEISIENYEDTPASVGEAAYIDLYISLDKKSRCAVITWYSLSTPFLISHYMDNIIRNQLLVDDGGSWVNIYDYLNKHYNIVKRGTPKIFATIPQGRECLTENQLASMLASETIYPDGEDFGSIIDEEIIQIVSSQNGMGQYDRGFVCAYTNSLLQFSPDLKCDIPSRFNEESIALFYIELILMEEAAIHIADRATTALFTSEDFKKPVDFLKHVDSIYDDYSKTIEFWDVQVNYPTSQKSINMLRKAFRISEQLEYLNRNQEQLKLVFDTKSDIADRTEDKRTNTALAIISVFAVFSAWMDSHDYLETWGDIIPEGVMIILQRAFFVLIFIIAIYVVRHLFGNDFSALLKRIVKKFKKK